MKKSLLFTLSLLIVALLHAGNPVTVKDAKTAAAHFLTASNNTRSFSTADLTLQQTVSDEDTNPLYYVFSINGGGFVVVSAHDAITPILAYSLENDFDASIPNYLMNKYKAQTSAARNCSSPTAEREWDLLLNAQPTRETYLTASVQPLTTSRWNQAPYYNNYCPAQDPFPHGSNNNQFHTPTGCVATAMAGFLHYHRYPVYGSGHIHYQPVYYFKDADNNITDSIVYPVQDQDLDTEHNYEMMPNSISTHTGEVAELMWHAGISIEISYGPTSSSGYSAQAVNSLKEHWGYNPNAYFAYRSNYNVATWSQLLHHELDEHRIIFYSARETSDPTVGHAFLLDGYQDFNRVVETVHYTDTLLVFDHVDTLISYDIDPETLDSTIIITLDSIFVETHSDSTITTDTLFSHTMIHVNWGWGGYLNGYFTFTDSHVEGWSVNESAAIDLYPAGNPEEPTEGCIRVIGTRGTLSDGSGCRRYSANTDRSWMLCAPEANRYTFSFQRMETEENADEIIFYKNGDLNQETGRYSGHTLPSSFNINADSVLVRFVSNENDVVDYGFVIDYTVRTPAAYCQENVQLPTGTGVITDKGDLNLTDTVPYRPDSYCNWKIIGTDRVYFSYPQIDLAEGDYIEIYDITIPTKYKLLKRISLIDWPDDDVFIAEAHKVQIVFVSDNYLENNGFTLTYETQTDIHNYADLHQFSLYPNPATNVLNLDWMQEEEGVLNFRITDLSGRTVAAEQVTVGNGMQHHTFNISTLAKGIYLLNIESAEGKTVKKFIVQ